MWKKWHVLIIILDILSMLIKYTFIPNDNDNTNIALLTKICL